MRFLGHDATRNGPFGVLGLSVCDAGEADVLAAVHGAMSRIDAHPESSTPAADEARLAVHAAAANLLDDAVRAELLRRLTVTSPDTASPSNPRAGLHAESSLVSLEADVLRCIAGGGGWNKRAMRQFLVIAHMKGHTTAEAVAAIRSLWRGGSQPPNRAGVASRHPASPPVPSSDASDARPPREFDEHAPAERSNEEPQRGLSPIGVVLLTVAVSAVIALGMWIVWEGITPRIEPERPIARPASPPDPALPAERTGASDDAPDQAEAPRTGRWLDNGPAIIHEFETAVEGLAIDA
ncbi:MAG: hypothetical protein K8E66_08085, partial [Phycisphaerales bacterium]|nr:hypothetical protein [Phycisphaerales bacterium]